MKPDPATVSIVDDDASVRKALERLLRSEGYTVATFASALEFLDHARPAAPGCLVLDIHMPDLDGLMLQERLLEQGGTLPIVFITGHGTVPASVKAMKAGALDFLQKPFQDHELLDAVAAGIATSRRQTRKQTEMDHLQQRFSNLTPREQAVFSLVAVGLLNKQIAAELGIVEKTVKAHRAQVMTKMGATSLADLVRFAEKLRDLTPARDLNLV